MLDHVSIPVVDLDRAAAFYDAVLATIGLHRRKERPGAIGYGPETRAAPVFWILERRDGSASPGLGSRSSSFTVSLGSTSVSATTVTAKVLVVSPEPKVSVPAASV